MTDLEITKLCAEAMGHTKWGAHHGGMPGFTKETGIYDPLADDAQAMALVKKLNLDISHCDPSGWVVFSGRGDGIDAFNENLNRAICECVAKMQASK